MACAKPSTFYVNSFGRMSAVNARGPNTDVDDILLVADVQVVQEGVFGERRQQHGVALSRLRRVAHAARHRAPTAARRAPAAPPAMSPRAATPCRCYDTAATPPPLRQHTLRTLMGLFTKN